MIWRKPTSHKKCYFCLCNLLGYNSKNKHLIKYPNLAFVTKPILVTSLNVLPTPPAMIAKCKKLIFEDISNDENYCMIVTLVHNDLIKLL